MPRGDVEFAVHTEGLGKLNRSLGRISKDLRRDSVRHLRHTAKNVRDVAKPLAPVRTGALARSLRYSATNKGATVYSNLPQAPVFEYGGTIAPRGVPITIPRVRMLGTAVRREAPQVEQDMARLFDVIGRSNGFQ